MKSEKSVEFAEIEVVLLASDAPQKAQLAQEIYQRAKTWGLGRWAQREGDIRRAGAPEKPQLVGLGGLKMRKPHTAEGYAALLHSVCHIEFNAINLALDAAWRFRHLGEEFTLDWLKVAAEEGKHFLLMRERLCSLGFDYGSFPAHDGLWEMADKTAFDPLLRMALVPRVLEARGLDVTPAMREKILQKGDLDTVAVLDVIYQDEVGHVAIGNKWYARLCKARGLEPMALFRELMARYDLFVFRGYVNREARGEAGFSEFELDMLAQFEEDRLKGQKDD